MKLTSYFIHHPVSAIITNIMIVIIGLLCFQNLPFREYPEIVFPAATVNTSFPNASAELVEKSITNILEERLGGVEGVELITSESRYGQSVINLQFRMGTNIDRQLNLIRDAINQSKALLPTDTKDPVITRKTLSDMLPFMLIVLEAPNMTPPELTHFANIHLKNAFKSIKGIASVGILGQPYTYTIVLDPKKMFTFGINAEDVFTSLKRSNFSLPTGKFRNQIPSAINTELKTVSDYENVLLREKDASNANHIKKAIFLKDVATVAFIGDDQRFRVRINGKPSLCIALNRTNEANPVEVSKQVNEEIALLNDELPEGVHLEVLSDQAEYVRHSLKNVQNAIFESIGFVILVVFIFFRNVKATFIPIVTIPISLIGSFILLKLFGFSFNIMTLMAMVLAVGLVVDDAIVVLENIQQYIEKGEPPFSAAIKGAKEMGFAIVAMTLTLTSVYAPLLFLRGEIGQLFAEFAVALAGSVLISGVVALTLTPLMCSKVLSNKSSHIFPRIDTYLEVITSKYQRILYLLMIKKRLCLLVMMLLFGAIILLSLVIPKEMAPKEDRGLIGVYISPTPGKDINATDDNMKNIETALGSIAESTSKIVLIDETSGNIILPLKPKSQRNRTVNDILDSIRSSVSTIPAIDVHPWNWNTGLPGSEDVLKDNEISLIISTTGTYRQLFDQVEKVSAIIEKDKLFKKVRNNLKLDTLEYRIDLNTNEMAELNITAAQVAKAIEVFFSGDKSMLFLKDGILYNLTIKGLTSPHSLNEVYVTNKSGEPISLGVVASMMPTAQPVNMYHYNQLRALTMTVYLEPNIGIDTAMKKISIILKNNLPKEFKISWTGAAKDFLKSKVEMIQLFVLALIFIYAILAIQFGNFIDPFIILITVPLACAGALFFVWIFGQSFNIYTQVGLITLIGLITKHGILIVEFANQLIQEKIPLLDATIRASSLRLRPILMTTGAMIFGSIPLLFSTDAGSESRRAIGVILIGGLTIGTILTLYILPTVYVMIKKMKGSAPERWTQSLNESS